MKGLHKNLMKWKSFLSAGVAVWFLVSTAAAAQTPRAVQRSPIFKEKGFKPKIKPIKTPTSNSGVRGVCGQDIRYDLSAIAPISYTAQLSKNHPIITWYVPPSTASELQVRLYRNAAAADKPSWELIHEVPKQNPSGIMSESLPLEKLVEGQIYAWQVELICNPKSPSLNPVITASFEVVATPISIQSAKDAAARSKIYAEAGIWYSAYAEAAIADQSGQRLRASLLTDLLSIDSNQLQQDPSANLDAARRREQLQHLIEVVEKKR